MEKALQTAPGVQMPPITNKAAVTTLHADDQKNHEPGCISVNERVAGPYGELESIGGRLVCGKGFRVSLSHSRL